MRIITHIRGRFARTALAVLLFAGCTGDSLVDPGNDTFTPPPLETFSGKVVISDSSYKYFNDLTNPLMGLMWIKDQQIFDILNLAEETPLNNAVMGLSMEASFPLNFEITIPQLPNTGMLVDWIQTVRTYTGDSTDYGGGIKLPNEITTQSVIGNIGLAGIFLYNDTDRDNVYDLNAYLQGGDYYKPSARDWMAGICTDHCIMYVGSDVVLRDIAVKNNECAAVELAWYGESYTGIFGLRTGYNLVKVMYAPYAEKPFDQYTAMYGWRFERVDDDTDISVTLSDVRTGFEYDWLVQRDRR